MLKLWQIVKTCNQKLCLLHDICIWIYYSFTFNYVYNKFLQFSGQNLVAPQKKFEPTVNMS